MPQSMGPVQQYMYTVGPCSHLRLADVLSRADVRAAGELRADVRADVRRAGDWVPTVV